MTDKHDKSDMSEVSLGKRYSSEDMYRDYPDLRPGDRIAVEKDGVIYTDTVRGVTYSSPEPEMVRRLSFWQRVGRRLTPPRFRKSLVVRQARPATVTIETVAPDDDVLERHQRRMKQTGVIVDALTRDKQVPPQ